MPKETIMGSIPGVIDYNAAHNRAPHHLATGCFIIGDVHGHDAQLERLLQDWNQSETLILIGDYINKGPSSKEVLRTLTKLYFKHQNVIALRGNHENLFLKFLREPLAYFTLFQQAGGDETVYSLLGRHLTGELKVEGIVNDIHRLYPKEIAFIKRTQLYVEAKTEAGRLICAHAGVDFTKQDWRLTNELDFLTIRDNFHSLDVPERYKDTLFVAGHTPTLFLNRDSSNAIWHDANRFVIDGNVHRGGELHGLRVNTGITSLAVPPNGTIIQTKHL